MSIDWIILTGEYPPTCGGVGDYTRQVAARLGELGGTVRVFAPSLVTRNDSHKKSEILDNGVTVYRLGGHFNLKDLFTLNRRITKATSETRLLLQYLPHAYGYKAMNVPFAIWLWLVSKRRILSITTMFHEVAYPFERGQAWRHKILATVNCIMAAIILRASDRVLISIPSWQKRLTPLAKSTKNYEYLPVPSNVPPATDTELIASIHNQISEGGKYKIIGQFGLTPLIQQMAISVLREMPLHRILLIGKNSREAAAKIIAEAPELAACVLATGEIIDKDISAHLSACDILLQVYPDGISARRTSAMAGLALGIPIVTTAGCHTEDIWRQSGAVSIAKSPNTKDVIEALTALSRYPELAKMIATKGVALYRERFSLDHTISALCGPSDNTRCRNVLN